MKNKVCGIYKITSPTGKVYIGQSIDLNRRLRDYKTVSCVKQIRLYNSFLKHGIMSHRFEILHICNEDELNDLEKKYISIYNSFNKGLNSSEGGNSLSDESRKKISESKKGERHHFFGKKQSRETIDKRSKSMIGRIVSETTRQKLSLAHTGMVRTKEAKEKMRLAKIGRVGFSHNRSKPVIQQDLSGRPINTFGSILLLNRETGFSPERIRNACNNNVVYKSSKWKFANEKDNILLTF